MAYQTINNIKLGTFPKGEAFGGLIYNLSFSDAINSSQPTTIEINVISTNGQYTIGPDALNTVLPYDLVLGDIDEVNAGNQIAAANALYIQTMFLYEYDFTISNGQKVLNLRFKDGSVILDKIQVAILNEDATPLNFAPNTTRIDTYAWRNDANPKLGFYMLPVECNNPCWQTGRPAWGTGAVNPWVTAAPKSLGQPYLFPRINNLGKASPVPYTQPSQEYAGTNMARATWHGGTIIIGQEEFRMSECEFGEITYRFEDLLSVINNEFARLPFTTNFPLPPQTLREKATLRKSFRGSLRQVINDWCNIYGFSWKWDFTTDVIFGYDKKQREQLASRVDEVRQAVEGIRERNMSPDANKVAVTNYSYGASLEGNKTVDHITNYKKPARTVENSMEKDHRVFLNPLSLTHLFPAAKFQEISGGRTEEELIISSVLAKYDKKARTLYNYKLIADKTTNFTDLSSIERYGKPLGMNIRGYLSNREKFDLLNTCFSNIESQKNQDKYGKDSFCALGTFSKEQEDKWIQWEVEIANFIGKHYFTAKPAPDLEACSRLPSYITQWAGKNQVAIRHYKRETTLRPNAETYNRLNFNKLPFDKVLRHPNASGAGIDVQTQAADPNLLYTLQKYTGNEFFLFSRNPSYGFKDEYFDSLMTNKGSEHVLDDFLPSFMPLEGQAKLILDSIIADLFPDVYLDLEKLEKESKKPSLLFFPTASKINDEVIQIDSSLTGTKYNTTNFYNVPNGNLINKFEYEDESNKKTENTEEECNLICDLNVFNDICECPGGDAYKPELVGLTNFFTRHFRILVNHKDQNGNDNWKRSIPLTIPSESPYSAYLHLSENIRYHQQATFLQLGYLNQPLPTSMSYEINSEDVSNEFDSTNGTFGGGKADDDGSGELSNAIQIVVPSPWGTPVSRALNDSILDFAKYHQISSQFSEIHVAPPNFNLTFELVGKNLNFINKYIAFLYGLDSFSVRMAEEGTRLSFQFSSSPPELPNREAVIRTVKAQRYL